MIAAFAIAFVGGCFFIGIRLHRLERAQERVTDAWFTASEQDRYSRLDMQKMTAALERLEANFSWPPLDPLDLPSIETDEPTKANKKRKRR